LNQNTTFIIKKGKKKIKMKLKLKLKKTNFENGKKEN